jgi:hypothetical protein
VKSRYELASSDVFTLLKKVRTKWFSEFKDAKVGVFFDLKERTVNDATILARIIHKGLFSRYLPRSLASLYDGQDYIITFDKVCWENTTTEERTKILRHELRHIGRCEDGSLGIVDHDVEDFMCEIIENVLHLDWDQKVGERVREVYDKKRVSAKT